MTDTPAIRPLLDNLFERAAEEGVTLAQLTQLWRVSGGGKHPVLDGSWLRREEEILGWLQEELTKYASLDAPGCGRERRRLVLGIIWCLTQFLAHKLPIRFAGISLVLADLRDALEDLDAGNVAPIFQPVQVAHRKRSPASLVKFKATCLVLSDQLVRAGKSRTNADGVVVGSPVLKCLAKRWDTTFSKTKLRTWRGELGKAKSGGERSGNSRRDLASAYRLIAEELAFPADGWTLAVFNEGWEAHLTNLFR